MSNFSTPFDQTTTITQYCGGNLQNLMFRSLTHILQMNELCSLQIFLEQLVHTVLDFLPISEGHSQQRLLFAGLFGRSSGFSYSAPNLSSIVMMLRLLGNASGRRTRCCNHGSTNSSATCRRNTRRLKKISGCLDHHAKSIKVIMMLLNHSIS